MSDERIPYLEDLASWLGVAWIVAFLAGFWGAMIGIGKFQLSEFLFLLIGAVVLGKVAYETLRDRTKRRLIACAICIFCVASLEFAVVRWSGKLAEEAEEQQKRLQQLDQLPMLQGQISELKAAEKIDQAKSQQQLADIGQNNSDLKSSIEKKDAILASIAQQQYALNFRPQVFVASNGSIDSLLVTNSGKTSLTMSKISVENIQQDLNNAPALIAPGNNIMFQLHKANREAFAARALGGNADRIPVEGVVYLTAQDEKNYLLPFTWFFTVKNGAVTRTDIIARPLIEVNKR